MLVARKALPQKKAPIVIKSSVLFNIGRKEGGRNIDDKSIMIVMEIAHADPINPTTHAMAEVSNGFGGFCSAERSVTDIL